MEKRYFCFECGTNVIEDKMENRIAGWFGICKRCSNNSNSKSYVYINNNDKNNNNNRSNAFLIS
jgi:DNA-directed RNA polymerase subunit M/transcription elongation factor TFIIS